MEETPISPVQPSRPELSVDSAAIDTVPVELDGTPTSPEQLKAKLRPSAHPVDGASASAEDQQKLAELISLRKSDPAVMQDIPMTPGAEEFDIAGVTKELSNGSEAPKGTSMAS
ncbi:hypothetical protein H2203_004287 [Taxawa tesnikishii (nom. ined.)]|nr:hypothetical protein H2203_004287 [Dothideales sp. JES 119]